jgi:hypothetical protein
LVGHHTQSHSFESTKDGGVNPLHRTAPEQGVPQTDQRLETFWRIIDSHCKAQRELLKIFILISMQLMKHGIQI